MEDSIYYPYGEERAKQIVGEFRFYVHQHRMDIECECDLSEAVNEFMCRECYYGENLYNLLMKEKNLIKNFNSSRQTQYINI